MNVDLVPEPDPKPSGTESTGRRHNSSAGSRLLFHEFDQIFHDLLIRTKHAVHVIETKFRRTISKTVIGEVREKAARLKLPAGLSVRSALIDAGELDPAIKRAGFFDHLIPAEELFR